MAILCCIGIKIYEKMIMIQITSLKINIKNTGMNNKVARCGNKRALYALARQNMFIFFCVFQNYTQEDVQNMIKLELFLVFFPVGYLNTILVSEINKV